MLYIKFLPISALLLSMPTFCPFVNAIREMTKITSNVLKLLVEENKSEEKDIKLTVFYRKMVFFSSFCGNLINFVRVLLYNKVQLI